MSTLKTEFPMYEKDHPHWDSLVELMDTYRLHETYIGDQYYKEMKTLMTGIDEGEDQPFCLEYTEEAFVKAWNETKSMVEYWDWCEAFTPDPTAFMQWQIDMLQNQED